MTLKQLFTNLSADVRAYLSGSVDYREKGVYRYTFDHDADNVYVACNVSEARMRKSVDVLFKHLERSGFVKTTTSSVVIEALVKMYYLDEINLVECMLLQTLLRNAMHDHYKPTL